MGKSLTETAKAILMKESNDPTPDRGAKTMNPNSATLRPGSRSVDSVMANPGAIPAQTGYQTVAVAPMSPGEGSNFGAAAAGGQKKDKTVKGAGTAGGDSRSFSNAGANSPEVMEEDAEFDGELIDEQIDSYIDQLVSEGYDEDTIAEAVAYYFGEYLDEETIEEASYRKSAKRQPDSREFASLKAKKGTKVKAYFSNDPRDNPNDGSYVQVRQGKRVVDTGDYDSLANAFFTKSGVYDKAKDMIQGAARAKKLAEEEAYEIDMSEAIEALFSGEDLSEDFKIKAQTIFEAAVNDKINEELAIIEEAYAETLEEQIEQIQEDLSSNVDDYLNYVVEQWVGENEVAIEAGLRSELTEDFISGLRSLFAEHYIDIPEDKISIVEEMGEKVVELEEKLNEEIERNVQLSKYLNESKQYEILTDACDDLTVTQAEKLKSLSEGIEFNSVAEYAHKVNILKENYFIGSVNNSNVLDNNEVDPDSNKAMLSEDSRMSVYTRTLGKKLPN